VQYVEQHIPLIRRGRNGVIVETAAELIAVAFAHHTSRQTGGQADREMPPDPQVHTHVLMPFAMRHDGEIAAINSAALFRGRQEIEAVYHTALADRLAEMGFEIQRGTGKKQRYFEIGGISEELCAEWSSRHQEIAEKNDAYAAEIRAEYGRTPGLIKLREQAVRSRIPKGRTYPDPATYWREIGAAHGVTAATIDALCRPGSRPAAAEREAQFAAELLGEDGLTREHATFNTQALKIGGLRQAVGLLGVDAAAAAITKLADRGDLRQLQDDAWSTEEMLALERDVLAWRERRRALPPPPQPTNEQVWHAIRAQQREREITLSGEQLEAFRTMLRDGFTAVTGEAGVGKGVVLEAAADVWRSQGRRVFAVAVAGATAQRLAADMGEGVQAMTLDGLTTGLKHRSLRLRPDDVIALDEAGMVDTRRWAKLAGAIGDIAHVVALGDAAQLSPLSAGGLWPMLADDGPRISGIRRTMLGWEAAAWQHLRAGETLAALGGYAEHGHLTVSATRWGAVDDAVRQWDADGRTGLIITDASNAERHRANVAAQQRRVAAHELGAMAQFLRTEEGLVALHAGDRVIFRRQWRIGGGVRRVENGTTGQVVAVDIQRHVITVRTDEAEPRELEVSATEADPLLDLNYAAHVYKAQGATVDRTYVIAGGWQTHRESLYVACSRSRLGSHLFLDRESLGSDTDADALTAMAARGALSRGKVAATSLHSPAVARRARLAERKRTRQVLTSRKPLVDRYRRRQELRWARYEGRRTREYAGFEIEHRAHLQRSKRYRQKAAVPSWVVEAFERVTGMAYGLR
jgi:AAA domain/TrwC relaxase